MKQEDAEEWTQSLGQIVGGSWRQIVLAKRLGVPQALGLSTDEWVNKRLGGYVKMNVDDRRPVVQELAGEGMSTREIGEIVGVSHQTVANDLGVNNLTEKPVITAESVNNLTDGIPTDEELAQSYVDAVDGLAALALSQTPTPAPAVHVSHNSGENEWYTPPVFIAAARAAMGDIDVDPASSPIANDTVGATTYYTAADNGLTQPWRGAVWMNPPYAQPLIADFCEAVTAKFQTGEIAQACVLVNNATETAWFQRMLEAASAVCLIKTRIRFLDTEGNPGGAPLQGQALVYFGPNVAAFGEHFNAFGKVLLA